MRGRSGRGGGGPGPAGEPVVLRVHRHPEGQDAGAVRPTRTRPTERYVPFHLYSMRQAIEEGFILDVLANYTTYETYFQIDKAIADDPELRQAQGEGGDRPVRVAARAQPGPEGRDHRRALPRPRRQAIGGKAKAMVVTASRLHAVRYKQALDRYCAEHGIRRRRTRWWRSPGPLDDRRRRRSPSRT